MNRYHVSPLLLIAIMLALLAGGCGGPDEKGSGKRGRPVVALKAYQMTLHDKVEALGTAQAGESITITARVAGRVESLLFADGDQVKKGQIIARMDQDEELAQLAAAEAQLSEHRREIKRLQTLLARKAAATRDLDERQTLAAVTIGKIAEIRARIEELTLTAPFAGRLGIRRVSPGAVIQPGTVITTLDAADAIKLDFTIPSTRLSGLKAGAVVKAVSDAVPGMSFSGKLTGIDSRIDPLTRAILLRAEIDNRDGKLLPGMLMRVTLYKDERQTLVVPEESITQKQAQHFLTLVGDDGRAEIRSVEIGLREDGLVEIRKGLRGGELVAVRGMGFVKAGQPLTLSETWTTIRDSHYGSAAGR